MCGYCCGGMPVEKRGEGHKNCSIECYNAPRESGKSKARHDADIAAAKAAGAAEVIARVEDELLLTPCYVTRNEAMSCTDWIGSEFGNGVWLKAMCCLPCRLRAALTTGGEG